MRPSLLDREVLAEWLAKRTDRDPSTNCLLWNRSVQGGGYAQTKSPWGNAIGVHRLVYLVFVGPLNDSLEVHHTCGNRRCCEPSHLTALSDIGHKHADANWAGNKTHCKRGHPLSGDNLSPSRLKAGKRICKTCANLRFKAYRERQGEAYRAYNRGNQRKRRAPQPSTSPTGEQGDHE